MSVLLQKNELNIVLVVVDGHGSFTGNMNWGTKEFFQLKERMDRLRFVEQGYIEFSNMTSPAVSTIMSIESILSGIYAAKTHKLHWREWPSWDRFDHPTITRFLKERGYEVQGFSYLLNSENWIPSLYCYRPDLYKNYQSFKRDTHSHEAVLAAVRHYFENDYRPSNQKHCFVIHSIFLFDIWEEIMDLFASNGFRSDNTIFAFTADHYFPYRFGRQWLLGERDQSLIFHHTDLTEHNSRVFFYLKYPGSVGATIDVPVAGYDITPTVLDLLGMLQDWPATFDGASLLPLIKRESFPERFLRCDNMYPFQIGEKQGRITSIKRGKNKYVVRPDPVSSYIAYRLTEEWSLVLQREEFYNVEQDPYETKNLFHDPGDEIRDDIAAHKAFLQATKEEIINFHVATLCRMFTERDLKRKMFKGRERGQLLCVQSCPDEVFQTIIRVLKAQLPQWDVDVVVKKQSTFVRESANDVRRIYVYPYGGVYEPQKFTEAFIPIFPKVYDCIINTSNVPMGDYIGVYDDSEFPVGDFSRSATIIAAMNAEIKYSLSLDMSYQRIGESAGIGLRSIKHNVKSLVVSFIVNVLRKIRPYLKEMLSSASMKSAKMSETLSKRLIRKADNT